MAQCYINQPSRAENLNMAKMADIISGLKHASIWNEQFKRSWGQVNIHPDFG